MKYSSKLWSDIVDEYEANMKMNSKCLIWIIHELYRFQQEKGVRTVFAQI
jgi:hypothetical protein